MQSNMTGLSLILRLSCGISDNLAKAAAVCPPSLVSDFWGQDPFHAPCSCSRLSVEDLGEQDSHGFVFSAPGESRRLVLEARSEPAPLSVAVGRAGDTSWHSCGVIFVWAGGIFLFFLMVSCGQPKLLSCLIRVCHHSYFSPKCFPVFASAVK